MTTPAQVSIVIDLPGKFDSFFSGSSVAQNPKNYSHEADSQAGAEHLHAAYIDREMIPRGKGHSLRLRLAGPFDLVESALDVLTDYTDACRVANGDAAGDRYADPSDRASARAEITASLKVDERVAKALAQARLQRG